MVLAQYNISYRGHGTEIRHRRLMTELEYNVTNYLKIDSTMATKSCAKASIAVRESISVSFFTACPRMMTPDGHAHELQFRPLSSQRRRYVPFVNHKLLCMQYSVR